MEEEQRSRCSEAFCYFDRDGDGFLSAKEAGGAMRSLGVNVLDEEAKDVDLQRFMEMMEGRMGNTHILEEQLLKAFRFFDRNQSGSIYVGELRHLLTTVGDKLTAHEFDQWIDERLDCDSDGRILFQQLVKKTIAPK